MILTRSNALMALLGLLLAGAPVLPAMAGNQPDGWQIPPTAQDETNPVPVTPVVLAKGKDLFRAKCARCHGPAGRGDGTDADPDHPPTDLTDGSRASRNPDGVMYYKVWNGRRKPKMPAFSSELSREEVWALVAYVKTLRK